MSARVLRRVVRDLAPAPLALLLALGSGTARAQNPAPDPDLWDVGNANVMSAAISGSTLYVGGLFDYIGPRTGASALTDSVTGAIAPGWPRVRGQVCAVAPDGAGGWYVGGSFDEVAGLTRSNLAHLRADLSLDAWAPAIESSVLKIAVGGGAVYVAGGILRVNGMTRTELAAFDATTGALLPWDPEPNGGVYALTLAGGVPIVGGDFSQIGGQPRSNIAALDPVTGLATAWNPGANGPVVALVADGATIYAGGPFGTAGGQARSGIAALDPATGAAGSWNPNADGGVTAIALAGGNVYLAGGFSHVGGQARAGLAAVDRVTGTVLSWNPAPAPSPTFPVGSVVHSLAAAGNTVYAGGDFGMIMGQRRSHAAAFDATSGALTAWNPRAGGPVEAFAAQGGQVCVGGEFTSVGGALRSGLASIDLESGAAADWAPELHETYGMPTVGSIVTHAGRVYVGGGFDDVDGEARANVAVFDSASGLLLPSNLATNDEVSQLLLMGDTLFVGGRFGSIGGLAHTRLAAIDTRSGNVLPWDARIVSVPNPLFPVAPFLNLMALQGDTLLLQVAADSVGGQAVNAPYNLVAVDARTGAPLAWQLRPSWTAGWPTAIAFRNGRIYLGGDIDGAYWDGTTDTIRQQLVAFDFTTGLLDPWDPQVGAFGYSQRQTSFAFMGDTLYVCGDFNGLGGQPRSQLGAVDVSTGAVTGWAPEALGGDTYATQILAQAGSVYAMGSLDLVEPCPNRCGIARFPPAPDHSPPVVRVLAPAGGETALVGGTFPLAWSASDDRGVQSADLLVSRAGPSGPWEPIALGLVHRASYAWTVTGPDAAQAWLRVDARDWDGNVGSATGAGPIRITSGPTPTLVEEFRLEDAADGVQVHWSVANTAAFPALAPQRGASPAGAWSDVPGTPRTEGRANTLTDHDVVAGGTYWYRLAGAMSDGRPVSVPPIAITHGGVTAFALDPLSPNPVAGRTQLGFAVPRGAHVRLTLVDVQGRVVAVLADGEAAAGRHLARLDAAGLAPGLYFVRLQAPGTDLRRRLLVIR